MKKVISCLLLAGTLFAATQAQAYTTSLQEYAFNVDGTVFDSIADSMPGTPNFNTSTGLGTISFSFGAGNHSVAVFFDHDIDRNVTGWFPEYGASTGTAKAGQSWQIDEPGYGNNGYYGAIYSDFTLNLLGNANLIPNGDDAAMAMGWNFYVPTGSTALVDFILGTSTPGDTFYLTQYDYDNPDSTVFLSSTLNVRNEENNPVPEPSTLALFGAAMAGALFYRRRINRSA